MPFSEFEIKRIDKVVGGFCRTRVSERAKSQLRYEYRIEKQNIILSECRPRFDDPSVWLKMDFVKFQYIKSRKVWKLYWMRASGKWQGYEPHMEDRNLDVLVEVMIADRHGCFFG